MPEDTSQREVFPKLDNGLAAAFRRKSDASGPGGADEKREQRGTRIGPYKILQEIGEGGFGIVYMAEQLEPIRRHVALKIIKPGMDTRDVIARFEAERQSLAMMDHTNIARVFDAGTNERGRPYFVMELVKGIPITEFCDKNNFDTEKRLKLFMTSCRAVQHAHHKGIIHRDIKPSNIMVTLHDGEPVPKVIDFGVSKAISQRLTEKTLFTRYGQMVGTPQYMSPEQAEMSGLDVDTRSDIYSLGVLLYELLTGTTPLEAKRLRTAGYSDMLRMIQEEEPAKPSTRLSTLGDSLTAVCEHRKTDAKHLRQLIRGDLDWIVMKALEKHRDRRYETANGLARDIQRHLNHEPVIAGPPSAAYRVSKLVRRNKIAFVAGAAVLIALFVGLAATTLGFARANYQRARAERATQDAIQQRNDARRAKADEEVARKMATNRSDELEWQVYAMHLANADEALMKKDLVQARVEVEACTETRRGWEWEFLADRAWITANEGIPGSGQPFFTSDGKRVIFIGRAETKNAHMVLFLNVASQTQGIELAHSDELICQALSSDDRLIAASDVNGNVFLWNRQTNEYVWSKSLGAKQRARAVAFHPQNSLVATINDDYVVKIFGTTADGDAEFTRELPVDHSDKFSKVPDSSALRKGEINEAHYNQKLSFSPDGRWLAVGGRKRSFLVHVSDSKQIVAFPPDTKVPTFCPTDSGLIATGNAQLRTVSFWGWDGENLTLRKTLRGASSNRFHDLCFSSDGSHVASAQGRYVTVWNVKLARRVATTETGARLRGGFTYWLAMSPSGQLIACCGDKGDPLEGGTMGLQLWEFMGHDNSIVIRPHEQASQLVRFSPNGRMIAIGSHRGQQGLSARESPGPVIIRDSESGDQLSTVSQPCRGFSWMPSSQRIVVARYPDNTHEMYDAVTGELVCMFEGKFAEGRPYVDKTGQHLSSIRWDEDSTGSFVVRTWNIESTKLVSEFPFEFFLGHGNIRRPIGGFWSAAINPAGDCVAVASGGDVRLWDMREKKELPQLPPHGGRIEETLAFTEDGRGIYLTTGQRFGLYDIEPNQAISEFSGPTGAVAVSPDKKHVVSCGDGVVIRDVKTGVPVITLADANEDEFVSVDWARNGQRIAAGRADGTVHIWKLPGS